MLVNWPTLKEFATDRNIGSLQYVNQNGRYLVTAMDSTFSVECVIVISNPAGADQTDFETNYLPTANQTPKSEVVTQFELNNKTLVACSDVQPCDPTSGLCVLSFVVPGTFTGVDPSSSGRFVDWGQGWFYPQDPMDHITQISIIDTNGATGLPAGSVVKTYYDTDMPVGQQGIRIPYKFGHAEVEPIGGYGFIPSTFTLQIAGQKGTPGPNCYMFANVFWGVQDG